MSKLPVPSYDSEFVVHHDRGAVPLSNGRNHFSRIAFTVDRSLSYRGGYNDRTIQISNFETDKSSSTAEIKFEGNNVSAMKKSGDLRDSLDALLFLDRLIAESFDDKGIPYKNKQIS